MELLSTEPTPFHTVRYLNAKSGGGTVVSRLPISFGTVDGLPDGLDALICASDLQGVVPGAGPRGESVLLGVVLAEVLAELAEQGRLARPERTGVLLAGDLYSAPGGDVRGASGDVRPVWRAFAEQPFSFVVGVAGNHDRFVDGPARGRHGMAFVPFADEAGVDVLDLELCERDGLAVGGVSWIAGNAKKGGRRAEGEQLDAVESVWGEPLDVFVLHEGPSGGPRQRGHEGVRALLGTRRRGSRTPRLVVCGHAHWESPVFEMPESRTKVLNVDARVVVLRRP